MATRTTNYRQMATLEARFSSTFDRLRLDHRPTTLRQAIYSATDIGGTYSHLDFDHRGCLSGTLSQSLSVVLGVGSRLYIILYNLCGDRTANLQKYSLWLIIFIAL